MRDAIQFPEIPENLSHSAVERRLLRACKTIRAAPDRYVGGLQGGQQPIWRESVREWDSYGTEEAKVKFIPTPFDVSDCLTALGWCRVLDRREFKLIWWRSFDNVSFAMIAARIGRSDETARRRFNDAISKCWSRAAENYLGHNAVA